MPEPMNPRSIGPKDSLKSCRNLRNGILHFGLTIFLAVFYFIGANCLGCGPLGRTNWSYRQEPTTKGVNAGVNNIESLRGY